MRANKFLLVLTVTILFILFLFLVISVNLSRGAINTYLGYGEKSLGGGYVLNYISHESQFIIYEGKEIAPYTAVKKIVDGYYYNDTYVVAIQKIIKNVKCKYWIINKITHRKEEILGKESFHKKLKSYGIPLKKIKFTYPKSSLLSCQN